MWTWEKGEKWVVWGVEIIYDEFISVCYNLLVDVGGFWLAQWQTFWSSLDVMHRPVQLTLEQSENNIVNIYWQENVNALRVTYNLFSFWIVFFLSNISLKVIFNRKLRNSKISRPYLNIRHVLVMQIILVPSQVCSFTTNKQ